MITRLQHRNFTTLLESMAVTEQGTSRGGQVDLPRDARRFHPGRGVHGVAPQVEQDPAAADDAADDTASGEPDPDLELEIVGPPPRRPAGRATDRELVVVAAILKTGSEKEAAHRLGLSHSTMRHHLANARSKVGAETTAQLVWILGPRLPGPDGPAQTDG